MGQITSRYVIIYVIIIIIIIISLNKLPCLSHQYNKLIEKKCGVNVWNGFVWLSTP